MTTNELAQQRLRDAIAKVDGLAVHPDGLLTWASADHLAAELLPFIADQLRQVARDLGPIAELAGDGPLWNPYRVLEFLTDRAASLEPQQ